MLLSALIREASFKANGCEKETCRCPRCWEKVMTACPGLNKTIIPSPLRLGELMERNSLTNMTGQRTGRRAVECWLLTLTVFSIIKTLNLHKNRPVNRHSQCATHSLCFSIVRFREQDISFYCLFTCESIQFQWAILDAWSWLNWVDHTHTHT